MTLLQVEGLTKRYPNFTLDHISFSLSEGRIMGLIGKNGAGKSTTLKSILNLVQPDQGMIKMFGMDFKENEEQCKQNIGVVLGGIDFYNFYNHKKLAYITKVTKRFYPQWDENAFQN